MTARTDRPLPSVEGSRRPSARRRLAAAAAVAITGSLLLTACGDQTDKGGEGGGGEAKSSEAPLFDKLPKDIQSAGVIKVGSDIAYAPVEFYDENDEIAGIDPDLGEALSKQLGVEFEFGNGTFDGLITGLNSGRHDIIMSAMTDTKQRQEGLDDKGEKVGEGVDFVDYFRAGSSILVKKGNPEGIKSLEDLCGETVALQRGTANETLAEAQSEKCDKPIKILAFDKDTEALLQVKQGRAVADINDYPVAAYNAKTSGGGEDFEVVGDQIDAAPYGIAVSKENTELRDAVKAALDAIIENGEYHKVLEKWEVTDAGVEEATVNGGK
ncbi:ABC transporter substrate-binding protein [Streptomyces verrucosisporus]|uniref:ABC transporter substrate-binding protein n=1 Tax=Streptomyces verrucosisporus TaxID=1695161 RepID=UPI0019D095CC|nr:ABC transporter substrate-binding protein [Streptomyces verrucosisporus]MBN3932172.1 ABC transporter substrate-binding protein [Streptomyces verrucosisporus]